MDQVHLSLYAKKLKEVVKAILFILHKSKRRFLVDLNLALKRGKLAGKSLIGKLAHHHHHRESNEPDYYSAAGVFNYPSPKSRNYVEFSCSSTPVGRRAHHQFIIPGLHHLINGMKGGGAHKARFEGVEEEFACALNDVVSTYASPAISFGMSPTPVRQLRVTDSPYPISSGGDSGRVDAAAEEFIRRFYSQLQRTPLSEG